MVGYSWDFVSWDFVAFHISNLRGVLSIQVFFYHTD